MKGGYQIINLIGADIATNGVGITIPGVYDTVEGSNKVILFENFSVDGIDIKPCMVNVVARQTEFTGLLFSSLGEGGITSYFITIADDDILTVESATIQVS